MLTNGSSLADQPSQFQAFLSNSENADALFHIAAPEFDESVKKLLADTGDKHTGAVPPEASKKKSSVSNSRRGLASYYGDIRKFEPFTRDEEKRVFCDYESVKKEIKKLEKCAPSSVELRRLHLNVVSIRNRIVEHNLRFVVKLARTFWVDGNLEHFENLISAGSIGLIRAVDKFDLSHGTRFLSYAAHWIALEIRSELADQPLIQIPVWYQKTLKKLHSAYKQLLKSQSAITPLTLAKESQVPVKIIAKLSDNSDTITYEHLWPLKADVGYCEIAHHSSFAVATTHSVIPSSESSYFHQPARKVIDDVLAQIKLKNESSRLSLSESDVIRFVFGLGDAEAKNLRQVSNVTNLSSERVRQLREKGLETMRKKLIISGVTSTFDLL